MRESGSPRAFNRRDDKGGIFTIKGMKRLEFSHCHCEEDDRTTRQSIVSRGMRTGLIVRLVTHSGSPRAFNRRDDKIGIFTIKGMK